MSLMAVVHFIRLRDEPHAQEEIRMYAQAMRQLVFPLFPISMEALLGAEK
jgi:thymidylate synthase (FAD)